MVLWVCVGLKKSVCAFVYFAHDFDQGVVCVCKNHVCVFVCASAPVGGRVSCRPLLGSQ